MQELPLGRARCSTALLGSLLALLSCSPSGDAPGVEGLGAPAGVGPVLGDEVPAGRGFLVAGDCAEGSCQLGGDEGPTPRGCGDGVLAADEACDDGNHASGDGCAGDCQRPEPGFSCAVPGQRCQPIARCGDGLVAPSEPCDDGNRAGGDGCSETCRVELGSKCEGEPSACTVTTCGDGVREGAEACDDGNADPFDGCSSNCLKEPDCSGASCVSECGDGLQIAEECDDGNQIDGDGCSASCTTERGFTCSHRVACERINGLCALRVPVVFRDFSDRHPDFGGHACTELALGAVAPRLNLEGRPTLGEAQSAQRACLSSDANLADWYADTPNSVSLVSELVLFDNGRGGYVNRYGAGGEPFRAVDPASERAGGASEAACEESCVAHARNGEAPTFDAPLRCEDVCRPVDQERSSLVSGELSQLQGDLNRASDAVPRDEQLVAEIEAAIVEVQRQIAELELSLLSCQNDCDEELGQRVARCAATCKPCSFDGQQWCSGGEERSFDGDPLFFPVDSITGDTANRAPAQIPAQYGYSSFPRESDVFPGAPDHNFYFTSEVQYWFRYDAKTNATLEFLGDDDVWVFVNGVLAVDLGGVHAPAAGAVSIDAAAGQLATSVADGVPGGVAQTRLAAASDFGLEPGNVYQISVYHAERQLSGSSFQLTLAGFEASASECSAICGDGVVSFGEECDDGENDGGYALCEAGCVLGPFCGDGIQQTEFGEECDEGPRGSAECRGCRRIAIR